LEATPGAASYMNRPMPRRALAIVVLLAGCRDRDRDHSPFAQPDDPCAAQPTLIVTAMPSELAPVLARMDVRGTVDHDIYGFTCGMFAGRSVALGAVGIGPVRASRGIASALERFKPSAVVMVGIAGALGHDLRVGDVTVPAQWSRHDTDPQWFTVDAALLDRARAAQTKLDACDEVNVCATAPKLAAGGNGVTGRQFIADPAVGDELATRLGAVVTDMETALVAQVAHDRGVPFVAVRAVSDLVWTGRSDEVEQRFGDLAAANAAAAAEALLR